MLASDGSEHVLGVRRAPPTRSPTEEEVAGHDDSAVGVRLEGTTQRHVLGRAGGKGGGEGGRGGAERRRLALSGLVAVAVAAVAVVLVRVHDDVRHPVVELPVAGACAESDEAVDALPEEPEEVAGEEKGGALVSAGVVSAVAVLVPAPPPFPFPSSSSAAALAAAAAHAKPPTPACASPRSAAKAAKDRRPPPPPPPPKAIGRARAVRALTAETTSYGKSRRVLKS